MKQILFTLSLVVLVAFSSCGKKDQVVMVTETRSVSAPADQKAGADATAKAGDENADLPPSPHHGKDMMGAAGASGADALPAGHPGADTLPAGHPDISGVPPVKAPGDSAETPPLTWAAPQGWTEGKGSRMRLVTFTTGPDNKVECYISVLSGAAGGVAANLNRWRSQMGQGELTAQDIAALPTIEVLGKPASVLEVSGSYAGMGDTAAGDHALLGVAVEMPNQMLFVKMVGPAKDVTAAEKENFKAFCKSIKPGSGAKN